MSVARCKSFCAPVDTSWVHDLLGNVAAQQHVEPVQQFAVLEQIAVLRRRLLRVAQGSDASWNDGNLRNAIGQGAVLGHDGMAGFVVGNRLLFRGVHHAVLLLQAANDAVKRLVKVGGLDGGFTFARRKKRRLVDEVGQVGAGKARCSGGNLA